MTQKPTYKELEDRIKHLEAKVLKAEQTIEKAKAFRNISRLMQFAPYGIFLIDLSGKILYANENGANRLGKTPDEIVGTLLRGYFPHDVSEKRRLAGIEAIRSGKPQRIEDQARGKWYASIIYPIKDESGIIKFLAIYSTDVTEIKTADKALLHSQKMLIRTENIAHIGSWEWEIEADTVTWSEGLYRIFQLDPNEKPPTWAEHPKLYHPEDFKKLRKAVEKAVSKGMPYALELRALQKDGETRNCLAYGYPERNSNGQVVRLFGSLHDITELKEAEKGLQESERKFRLVTETIQDVFWMSTPGVTEMLYVSPAYEKIWKKSTLQLYKTPQSFSEIIHPQDLDQYLKIIDEYHAKGKAYTCEYRILPEPGVIQWIQERGYPITDDQGNTILMTGLCTDITTRKEAEDELAQIFHMSLDMICIADIKTATFIKVNPAFTEILGYSEEELLEKPFLDFIHPEDIESTEAVIKNKLQTGTKVINFENRYRCKDGSYRWLSWMSHPIHEKGITFAIARDITELKETEKDLAEKRALLEATGRMAKVGGWEVDADTLKVSWTEETYRIHDVSTDYKPPLQEAINFFHPEDRNPLTQAIQRALREGEPYDMELRFVTAKGNPLWTHTICRPEIINGKVIRLRGTFQDITDRKEAEAALRKSEERLRDIFENSHDFICTHDLSGRILSANPQPAIALGYELNALLQMNLRDLLVPEMRLEFDQYIEEIKENGAARGLMAVRTNTGEKRIWEYNNTLRTEGVEEPIVRGIARDVTEKMQAEKALKESEERYRSLVENTLEGYFMSEVPSGRFLFLNQQICDLFGYTMQEGLSLSVWDVIDSQEHNRIRTRIQEREGKGPIHSSDIYTGIRKDGSRLRAEVANTLITYRGRPVIQGILRDVTEKEKLQSQLLQARKMESVGRLAGGVAHDFNNMLGVILGHAELAMSHLDPASPVHADLEEIQKAAQRSGDLTRQLLAFARKQMVVPKVLDLNETVSAMLRMLRRLIGEDIELAWIPGRNLWPIKIDPAQIDQILVNLCVNARDAIGGVGNVTIETQNVVLDEDYCETHGGCTPGRYVMLAISDDGRGMDKETLENVFEPFFTTKEFGEGTGLGLATIYGVVKQNNGYVNVYSEPGKGSAFKIYLPKTDQFLQTDRKRTTEPVSKGRETVLLVEDEPSILKMGKTVLERFGYTVLAAHIPSKALTLAEENDEPIHLLITDVVMPEMNGRALKEKIEALKPDIKVLYMSGYTANAIVHRGILDTDVHFLQKPFSVNSLAGKVREVLDQEKEIPEGQK